MRIVVTGASGNAGTALLRRLRHDGDWQVTGIARRPPDTTVAPYDDVTWVTADIGAPDAARTLLDAVAGADAVVHLAWSINPDRTEPPMDHTNVAGTRQVLRAVAETGVPHLVCASSCAAYRPPPRWRAVAEDWPRDGVPGSAYSLGKAELERVLDDFGSRHPETVVARVRPCAIVQRDAAGEFARWVLGPLVPATLLGRRWLPLPFWPRLRAQLVHSDDVAEALRLILVQRAGGAFNLAGDGVLDAKELAAVVGGVAVPWPSVVVRGLAMAAWRGGVLPIHPGWLLLADQAALVDTSKARQELGWRPARSAASILTELVTALRAGTGTASPPLSPHEPGGLGERVRAVRWGVPSHQTQSG